jgi:hypothetical protein
VKGNAGSAASVEIDNIAIGTVPSASGGAYLSNAVSPRVQISFNTDIGPSLSPVDLILQNTSTGMTIPSSDVALQYDTTTNTATFTFPGYSKGILPDGNYEATLPAGSIETADGATSIAPYSFNVFVLSADANHDRYVNALDFNALATNYGKAATFSQGDFDYSGTVDSSDFALLAARFGTYLAPPTGSMVAESTPAWSSVSSLAAQSAILFGNKPIAGNILLDPSADPLAVLN